MGQPVIQILQSYFSSQHIKALDPDFVPYDNISNPQPEWCEYYLFHKIFSELDAIPASYIGLFSYKFQQKALMTGAEVKKHIHAHPGFDVYLFNPYPYESYIFYNLWEQGDYYHSGILDLAQEALWKTGFEIDLHKMGRVKSIAQHCNFWVGNKKFWQDYMGFLMPIANFMLSNQKFFTPTTYELGPKPFFPFIIERLFTTYLAFKSTHTVCSYTYPEPQFIQLAVNEMQAQAYAQLSPLIKEWDSQHGECWPFSIRQALVQARNKVMAKLEANNISKALRF